MKVLFINTVFPQGSTGSIIQSIGNYLEKCGDEYKVAVGRGHNNDRHIYRIGSDVDLYSHASLSRLFDRSGFYSKRATIHFIRFIRDYNPDIIHIHNLHGYYINLKVFFSFLKEEFSGKVVWTLHDCWPFTGHCTHFTKANCQKWKVQCERCIQKKDYPVSYILDSSKKNYQQKKQFLTNVPNMTLVAVSDWLKSIVQESFLKEYHIDRIYNGVDLEYFKPIISDIRKQYCLENKIIILSVADGFNEKKGLSSLLRLAKEAPEQWQFVTIGISQELAVKLPANILGLSKIRNREELIQWYSAADVFYNPSEEETFGLVTVEAMACGTPVVVMNSTASPELILSDNCGRVIEINSDMPRQVDLIRQAIHLDGARQVASVFSLSTQCENYYKLYQSILLD